MHAADSSSSGGPGKLVWGLPLERTRCNSSLAHLEGGEGAEPRRRVAAAPEPSEPLEVPLWGASHKPVGQSSSTRLPCDEDLALLRRRAPPLLASALPSKRSGSKSSTCTPLRALNSAFGLVCERRVQRHQEQDQESDELAHMRSIWEGRLAIMALKNCFRGPLCGALGGRCGDPPFGLLPLGSAFGSCCEGFRPDTLTLQQGLPPLRYPHKMNTRNL